MLSDDEVSASFGSIANDSFHWGLQEITPPKNTTQVENPGTDYDKKRRKSKAFRKYEAKTQLQRDTGPRKTLVHIATVDTNDVMDNHRMGFLS